MLGSIYFGGAFLGGLMSFVLTTDAFWSIPAGPPVAWANGDVKPLQQWANADVKPLAQWANNITKHVATFTVAGKSLTQWGPENLVQTYFYNDPFITYNSPITDYDFIKDLNPSNQLLVTRWTGV